MLSYVEVKQLTVMNIERVLGSITDTGTNWAAET